MTASRRVPFPRFGLRDSRDPLARIILTLAGILMWGLAQGYLGDLLGFLDLMIPRYAIAGLLAVVPMVILWQLLPRTSGILGARRAVLALMSASALLVPFMVMAARLGMVYEGFEPLWPVYAGSLLLLALSEEVVCRGFLMDSLSFGGSRLTGLLLSSLVFAALHLGNESASAAGIANIFLAGVLFAFMRIATGGLVYPTLFHWLWNLMTGMVFGWSVSGHCLMPSLFKPASSPPWGGFGPEESILMTVGTLGAVAVLLKGIYSPDDDALPGVNAVSGGETEEVDTGRQPVDAQQG